MSPDLKLVPTAETTATDMNTMPFPHDPSVNRLEGQELPRLDDETDIGPPELVLNVSYPSPQVEEPPLRYLGSLGRLGQGVRSTPTTLSRNSRAALNYGGDGSVSLSSLATSGLDLRALPTSNNSREASIVKGLQPQPQPQQHDHAPDQVLNNATNSPKDTVQRVSFDNSPSPSALAISSPDKRAFSRPIRKSDPPVPSSPILRALAYIDKPRESSSFKGQGQEPGREHPRPRPRSRSSSRPKSRATSPLRILQQWSSGRHQPRGRQLDERFIPVNPFKSSNKRRAPKPPCQSCLSKQQPHVGINSVKGRESVTSSDLEYNCTHVVTLSSVTKAMDLARLFLLDTFPREAYLTLLLRLPALYFSRVSKIFEDAEVSKPDIQRMIEVGGGGNLELEGFLSLPSSPEGHFHLSGGHVHPSRSGERSGGRVTPGTASGIGISSYVGIAPASMMGATGASTPQLVYNQPPLPCPEEWAPPLVSPALIRFKASWETFIDSLIREWKTLNVVSALLLSAILTMFQVANIAFDPVIRNTAFMSLICALMSLSYGCMYIIRFGTMKSMYRASSWADEARKSKTSLWWNVWVFLAMPVVWLAW
ncbi:hypothetical protein AX15_003286 [Amanita polypyramis BW_CC]|nr:hypothetical protein AX15_003286 [Amanita polypyramis BW_CC]